MTKKIRVMYITDRFVAGGLEELQMITARFLPSDKYEIAFAAGHIQEGFYTRQIRQLGYPLYDLKVSTKLYDIRLILKLMKILRKQRKPRERGREVIFLVGLH